MSAEILYPAGPGNVATLLVSTQLARMDSVGDAVFSKRVLLDYLNRKAKKSHSYNSCIIIIIIILLIQKNEVSH